MGAEGYGVKQFIGFGSEWQLEGACEDFSAKTSSMVFADKFKRWFSAV